MGLTVFDAGIVIGLLDADDVHHHASRQALQEAKDRRDRLVLPVSALAETLVGPYRASETAVATAWEFINRLPVEVVALDAGIADAAAALRARHRSLKLPDALVIATASHLAADHLVTTDRGWPDPETLGIAYSVV